MGKSVDDYLLILYPNYEQLSDSEKKQYEKDRVFLSQFLPQFEDEYEVHISLKEEWGEFKYLKAILDVCKEQYDKETKIVDYVSSMLNLLNNNSYIANNFGEFLNYMYVEREQEEFAKDQETDDTSLGLIEVFDLTDEFLKQIDPSGAMVDEFRRMREEGHIRVLLEGSGKRKSNYDEGNINYYFDGTVNTAYTLVHEFMHRWIDIKAHVDSSRENHTMLNEFESIYYERAFIKFMNSKGLLKNGEDPVRAVRLKSAYSRDPDNCIIMLLELCRTMKEKGTLDSDSIVETLQKQMLEVTDKEELWTQLSELLCDFFEKNYFSFETIDGPVLYRFNTGIAMRTSLDEKMVGNIHKLVPYISDTKNDGTFMEKYESMVHSLEKINDEEEEER